MTNNQHKPAAIESYRRRREDVARLLDILDQELAKHAGLAESAPGDWRYPGTMDFIRSSLLGIVEGLSGIERDRIEETLAEV